MTLNDLVKRVKDRTYRGDVDVTTDDITAQIIRAANDARRKLIRRLPKEYLRKTSTISVVQGTTTYSLASDVQEPLLFRYTSSNAEYIVRKVDSEREFYDLLYSASAAQNKPTHYFDAGRDNSGYRQVILYPTPDASYTVNYTYYKDPSRTELTTSDLATEIPDVPSYLQDALVSGTIWLFLMTVDDKAAQDRAKADFMQDLIESDIAESEDQDSDLRFRFDVKRYPDISENTGLRIY